jgi:hypothetical protein
MLTIHSFTQHIRVQSPLLDLSGTYLYDLFAIQDN